MKADVNMAELMTAFLMHTAIHEVTHLLYPDSWSPERFHDNVTRVENVCHFLEPDIKKDVRKFLSGLKKDTRKLIGYIKKDKAMFEKQKRIQAQQWILSNCKFAKKFCPCCQGWPCQCPSDCKCDCKKGTPGALPVRREEQFGPRMAYVMPPNSGDNIYPRPKLKQKKQVKKER